MNSLNVYKICDFLLKKAFVVYSDPHINSLICIKYNFPLFYFLFVNAFEAPLKSFLQELEGNVCYQKRGNNKCKISRITTVSPLKTSLPKTLCEFQV